MEILFDSILSIMQPGKVGLHQGSVRMRQEQQSLTAVKSAADFKFRFQMTNEGARHACCVTIQAISEADATAIFRANLPTIEKLARLNLLTNDREEIRLDAVPEG